VAITRTIAHGTKIAIGIFLLWLGGLCLFVAFLSGKIASLTESTDAAGAGQGPKDVSGLVTQVAKGVQAAEQQGSQAAGVAAGVSAAATGVST
jgi:hypothetical protein